MIPTDDYHMSEHGYYFDFQVIQELDLPLFEQKVRVALKNRWELYGSFAVMNTEYGILYSQEMTKIMETEEN